MITIFVVVGNRIPRDDGGPNNTVETFSSEGLAKEYVDEHYSPYSKWRYFIFERAIDRTI